mgnify:CR=1 FL=1
MPIYEYWCEPCGSEFAHMRPMSESGNVGVCQKCGHESPRVPSVFASKENYTIKVPRGQAFRGHRADEATKDSAS